MWKCRPVGLLRHENREMCRGSDECVLTYVAFVVLVLIHCSSVLS